MIEFYLDFNLLSVAFKLSQPYVNTFTSIKPHTEYLVDVKNKKK